METSIAKYLIGAGLVLIIAGVLYYLLSDKLQWLGNLPGDIKVEGEGTRIYFPIVTMIIISVVLSIVVNVIRRFLG